MYIRHEQQVYLYFYSPSLSFFSLVYFDFFILHALPVFRKRLWLKNEGSRKKSDNEVSLCFTCVTTLTARDTRTQTLLSDVG